MTQLLEIMVTLFPFEDDETLCGIPIAGAEVVDWRGQQLCSRCCQEYEDNLAEYIGGVPEFSAFARSLGAPTISGHWRQHGTSAERDRAQMRALIARRGKPSSVAEAARWLFGAGRTNGHYWERARKALRGVELCNP